MLSDKEKELLNLVADNFDEEHLVFEPQMGGGCTAFALYDLKDDAGKNYYALITVIYGGAAPETGEKFWLGIYDQDQDHCDGIVVFDSDPYVWVCPMFSFGRHDPNPTAYEHMQNCIRHFTKTENLGH